MSYERAQEVISELPDTDAFVSRFIERIRIDKDFDPIPTASISAEWLGAIREIYEENVPRYIPPEPPKGTIENARWRDTVNALCVSPDIPQMVSTLFLAFKTFTYFLPRLATVARRDFEESEKGGNTVPLRDVADVHKLVCAICEALFFGGHSNPFPKLHDQFRENTLRISGKVRSKEDVIFPKKYKGDDLLAYFANTPLMQIFDARIPIEIPQEQRFMGHWICAPSGKGKTTLLYSMLLEDFKKDAAIFIMDCKGELINEVSKWSSIKDRLVLIEPDETLQINPLDTERSIHTIDLLLYLFSSLLKAELTAKQESLFRPCLEATLWHPNPNLRTFRDVVTKGPSVPLPGDLQEFFDTQFKEGYRDTSQEIRWRLQLLVSNPIVKGMFTAPKNLLNIPKLMNGNNVVIIDNSKDTLGVQGSEFFGRLILALIYGEAIRRSKQEKKHPVYVYIDEAQNVIARDQKVENIIDECRSQKIALIVSHQRKEHLTEPVLKALSNCGIIMAAPTAEASYFAPLLNTSAEELRNLPDWCWRVAVRRYGNFTMKVEEPAMPAHMTGGELAIIRHKMREQYCRHAETVSNTAEHTGTYAYEQSRDPTKDW